VGLLRLQAVVIIMTRRVTAEQFEVRLVADKEVCPKHRSKGLQLRLGSASQTAITVQSITTVSDLPPAPPKNVVIFGDKWRCSVIARCRTRRGRASRMARDMQQVGFETRKASEASR
jgi:hypothetical protein